uniref:Uncharacterized protein n=1 Tax=Mycena chlorophos TaxID=658473 RepID=A0ABQ0M1G6_MYCCL|nr:predicted protein [Mycena chlorophos]
MIDKKPGLLRLVYRSWNLVLSGARDKVPIEMALVTCFMPEQLTERQSYLGEIVSGCGGSIVDVAKLYATHINVFSRSLAASSPAIIENPVPLMALYNIYNTSWTLNTLLSVDGSVPVSVMQPGPFFEVLVPMIGTRALVAVLQGLASVPASSLGETMRWPWAQSVAGVIYLLVMVMLSSRARFRSALRRGIIPSLVLALAKEGDFRIVAGAFVRLVQEVLLPGTLWNKTIGWILHDLNAAIDVVSSHPLADSGAKQNYVWLVKATTVHFEVLNPPKVDDIRVVRHASCRDIRRCSVRASTRGGVLNAAPAARLPYTATAYARAEIGRLGIGRHVELIRTSPTTNCTTFATSSRLTTFDDLRSIISSSSTHR